MSLKWLFGSTVHVVLLIILLSLSIIQCSLNLYFIFCQKYKFGGSLLEGLIIHPAHNESIFLIKTKHSKGMTPEESIKSQRLYDYNCDFAKCHQDIWTGTLVVSRGKFRGEGEYRLGGWPLLFGGAKNKRKHYNFIVSIMEKMKTNTLEIVVIATMYLMAFARQNYFWFK